MHLRSHVSSGVLTLALVCLLALARVAPAGENRDTSSGVPMPVIPMGQGEACVADTDFMRRNHMDLLSHQRDKTVFQGLRAEAFSLKDCISCHVVKGPDAKALMVSDPKHFCRSCHDYASVSIDCFQCHASRPEVNVFPLERQFSDRLAADSDENESN